MSEPKMTSRSGALITFALAMAQTGLVQAEDLQALQKGAYQVDVLLELPHLDGKSAKKVAIICVTSDAGANYGLVALSDNNPLATCPATNVRQDGKTLTFDIVCEGTNAARVSAIYNLERQTFGARIAMKMGGKNMTMTETQFGHRVGDCSGSGEHHS
jgi:hypothetical protein